MKQNEKATRRGSMLDLFLILLALLCLCGLIGRWYLLSRAPDTGELASARVLLYADRADPLTAACLAEGDLLYREDGSLFGSVRTVQALPQPLFLIADGTAYSGTWDTEQTCRLQVEVLVEGRLSEGRFLHGGRIPLSRGELLRLYSSRVDLTFRAISVTPDVPA